MQLRYAPFVSALWLAAAVVAYAENPFLRDPSINSTAPLPIKDEADRLVYWTEERLQRIPPSYLPLFATRSPLELPTHLQSQRNLLFEQKLAARRAPPVTTALAQTTPEAVPEAKSEERVHKIITRMQLIESWIYKNALMEYELFCAADQKQLEAVKKYADTLEVIRRENMEGFANKLLEALREAQQREKERAGEAAPRVRMDPRRRAEAKARTLQWLQDLVAQNRLSAQRAMEIKAFVLVHEKKFGIEFEETYDPFLLLLHIANAQ